MFVNITARCFPFPKLRVPAFRSLMRIQLNSYHHKSLRRKRDKEKKEEEGDEEEEKGKEGRCKKRDTGRKKNPKKGGVKG